MWGESGVALPRSGRKNTFRRLLWLLDQDGFRRGEDLADRVDDDHWFREAAA